MFTDAIIVKPGISGGTACGVLLLRGEDRCVNMCAAEHTVCHRRFRRNPLRVIRPINKLWNFACRGNTQPVSIFLPVAISTGDSVLFRTDPVRGQISVEQMPTKETRAAGTEHRRVWPQMSHGELRTYGTLIYFHLFLLPIFCT